jgi:hypothetical protein
MASSKLRDSLAKMQIYDIAGDNACGRDVYAYLENVKETLSEPRSRDIDDIDDTVKAVCEVFQQSHSADRTFDRLTSPQSRTLYLFARRMAIIAMRTGTGDFIRLGLIALAIENAVYDFRETLGSLSFLQHSAQRISIDFPALVAQLLPLFSPEFTRLVTDFLRRGSSATKLGKFGFQEYVDANGITIG